MHVTDRSKTVVMLIDWDNLQICHSRDAPGTELDLQALIALAQSYGTLVSARAYAEWNLLSERMAVYKAGIEPVFAPVMRPEGSAREGKSLADTVMVADGVDLLWTVAPDVFVLVTSDKDMIPLARIAKQRGAAVVVLGSDLTAIPLVEVSNVFITYRQLLRELDRVGELEAPTGRAPARERRLRETRRPSTEPYGGPALAGGRGAPRGMGSGAGALGQVASSGSRRTITPAPPPESERERALAAPAAAPLGEETAPEPRPEPVGIGVTEVASPRRRRRRGGRGRRSGASGEAGEAAAAPTQPTEGGAEEHATPEAGHEAAETRATTPDDIDSAVLQLLAARDQVAAPAPAADAGHAPTEAAPSRPAAPPPDRPRIARTSFSTFGPPELPIQPPAPPPTAVPAVTSSPEPAAEEAAATPAEQTEAAAPAAEAPPVAELLAGPDDASGITPATPLPEAASGPATSPDLAPAVSEATPVASGEADTSAGPPADEQPAESATAERAAPSRPRTRRASRARAAAAASASPSTSPATASTPDAPPAPAPSGGDEAPRPARRRRTRRSARPSGDGGAGSSSGGSESGGGDEGA